MFLDDGGGDGENVGVADDAQAVLEGDGGVGVFPVVGDLGETVNAAGAEVVEGAVAGAVALGEAGEAGAHHDDAVGVVALGGDGGLLGDGGGAGLDEFLVFAGPVVVAVGLEVGGGLDGGAGLGGEVAKEGDLLEVGGEGALAVDLVHVGAQGRVVFEEVAQALPADLEQAGVVLLGEDGGGARHAREGGDLAEEVAGVHGGGLVAVEHAGHVLEKDGAGLVLAAAAAGDDLVLAGIGPELGEGTEEAFFGAFVATDGGGREVGGEDHAGAAGEDEKGGGAVVALAHDDLAGAEGADGGVVAQDVGERGGAREAVGIHRAEGREGEQALDVVGGKIGGEGGVPAAGTVEVGGEHGAGLRRRGRGRPWVCRCRRGRSRPRRRRRVR